MTGLGIIEEKHAINVFLMGNVDVSNRYEYMLAALNINHRIIGKLNEHKPDVIYREGISREIGFRGFNVDESDIATNFAEFLLTYISDESGYYTLFNPGTRIVYLDENFIPYRERINTGALDETIQPQREVEWANVIYGDLRPQDNAFAIFGRAHLYPNDRGYGNMHSLLRDKGITPTVYSIMGPHEDHIQVARSDMTIMGRAQSAYIQLIEQKGNREMGSQLRATWFS